MTYTFNRSFVDVGNRGFLKGADVPSDFSVEKIELLLVAGIVNKVEAVSEFFENTKENVEIEKLDPERQTSKKVKV